MTIDLEKVFDLIAERRKLINELKQQIEQITEELDACTEDLDGKTEKLNHWAHTSMVKSLINTLKSIREYLPPGGSARYEIDHVLLLSERYYKYNE